MNAEMDTLEAQMHHLQSLPTRDRKAILRRLTPEQRVEFARLETSAKDCDEANTLQARQYRGYSAWLGRLVQASESDGSTNPSLTIKPPVLEGIRDWHRAHRETARQSEGTKSLSQLAGALLQGVRRAL